MLTPSEQICRTCGYRAYGSIWLDDEKPNGRCPNGATGAPCEESRRRAAEEVHRRKVAPHCFDANGILIPGKSGEMWTLVTGKRASVEDAT